MAELTEKLNIVRPQGTDIDTQLMNLVINTNEVVLRLQENIADLQDQIDALDTRVTALE